MTELRLWISLFAAVGHLSLAVTAILAGGRSAVARPLAALCLALFGWNFSTLADHVVGGGAFSVADSFFTALTPPLVLEVVLAFVGQTRRRRVVRAASWVVLGSLALASLGGLTSEAKLAWLDSPSWAAAFLGGWFPTLVFEVVLLARHLGRTSDLQEKARTRTVLAALAIGAAFSSSDVARGLGLPMPYLGAFGTLLSAALLMTCAVRFELFDRNLSARTTVYVLGMIAAFVITYLVVFRAFAGSLAVQAFATAGVTVLVVAVARELATTVSQSRERVQRLAVLGRFSAQMAHDIKSPLTALLGAVQVLERTDDEATRKEFLELVAGQAKRVAAIVERYDRMGRVEPRKTLVKPNALVRDVARARGVTDVKLDPADPECEADRDLVESALENVVRNAVEASKDPGCVHVVTTVEPHAFVARVVDEGVGMDARQLERAFEDFFTTKTEGSGLGLSFARRVMLAHGGDVELESERGKGTTVTLRLPL
jgi:two-component system, NtrC family, sensor histidine kinase HydH